MNCPKLEDSVLAYLTVQLKLATDAEIKDWYGVDMRMTKEEENKLREEFSYALEIDKDRYK